MGRREKSKVYFIKEITPENVVKIFKELRKELPGKEHFLERVNSRHGTHTIDAAAELGFGTKEYELIDVE